MSKPRWDDLAPRLLSAAAMIAIGAAAVWLGGIWFHLLIAAICGGMVWELVHLCDRGWTRSRNILASAAFVVALVAIELPPAFALPLLMLPSMLGFSVLPSSEATSVIPTKGWFRN